MLPSWFAYLAVTFIVWGTIGYIRDILKGRVKPNLITWFLWSLAPLIALAAQLKAGVGPEATLTAAVGICPLAVCIFGLKRGIFKPQIFDWWCGGLSLIALGAWQISGSGTLGVLLSIAADTLAAAPTIKKTFLFPKTESPLTFAFFAVSAMITLMTVTQWTLINVAFSVYILVLYVLLFVLAKFAFRQRLCKVVSI